MWLRVSIIRLMVAILVVAIGFAALLNPSAWWTSALFTFTLALFLIATVGAIRAKNQTFWLGFALFGWSYMIASYEPWSKHATTPPPLLTTGLLKRLYPHISTILPNEVVITGEGVWKDSRNIEITSVATMGGIRFYRNDMNDVLQVGHFLASWLFAFVGGIAASRMFAPPVRQE